MHYHSQWPNLKKSYAMTGIRETSLWLWNISENITRQTVVKKSTILRVMFRQHHDGGGSRLFLVRAPGNERGATATLDSPDQCIDKDRQFRFCRTQKRTESRGYCLCRKGNGLACQAWGA